MSLDRLFFFFFSILNFSLICFLSQENRKSYDQSVAEALNAEKAWSELNDLLRQLQTKIAEAANTIRYIHTLYNTCIYISTPFWIICILFHIDSPDFFISFLLNEYK